MAGRKVGACVHRFSLFAFLLRSPQCTCIEKADPMNIVPALINIQQSYEKTSVASLLRGAFFETPWRERVTVWVGLGIFPFAPLFVETLLNGSEAKTVVSAVAVAYLGALWVGLWSVRRALNQRFAMEWAKRGGPGDGWAAKRVYLRYAIFTSHLNDVGISRNELERARDCLRLLPKRSVGDFSKYSYIPPLIGMFFTVVDRYFSNTLSSPNSTVWLIVLGCLFLAALLSHQIMRSLSDGDAEVRMFVEWLWVERQ